MYASFFGLYAPPFENKLDQRFLYLGQDHGEVLAALLFFVREKKGLAMVCGDVGTGKTMLLHGLLGKLPATAHPILISNPLVNYRELLSYIAEALELPRREETMLGLLDRIKETLKAASERGETHLLIIDEAHLLSDTNLEHIRLLSNIETSEGKLLQILLVGQYELSHRFNQTKFRALRQRINVNRFLSPFSALETWQYVEHRLEKSGSGFDRCFASECRKILWQLTGGVPRRINQLCDTAMLICMSEGVNQVNGNILHKAQNALQTDQIFTPRQSSKPQVQQVPMASSYASSFISSFIGPKRFLLVPLGCFLLLALGVMLGSSGFLGAAGHAMQKLLPGSAASSQVQMSPAGANPENSIRVIPPPPPAAPTTPPEVATPAQVTPVQVTPTPAASAKREETPKAPISENPLGKVGKIAPAPAPPQSADGSKISRLAPEGRGASALMEPAKERTDVASSRTRSTRPWQVEVEQADNLASLAARWFPGQEELGLVALLLANPQYLGENRIPAGQKLNLPVIDADNHTIQLKEGVFYALLGEYPSVHALQKTLSKLSRKDVRYTVMNNETAQKSSSYQVLIGAYGNQEDLDQALFQVNGKFSSKR